MGYGYVPLGTNWLSMFKSNCRVETTVHVQFNSFYLYQVHNTFQNNKISKKLLK